MVAQGCAPAAHKGMIFAAKAMSEVAASLYKDPILLRAARQEHAEFRAGHPFKNPVEYAAQLVMPAAPPSCIGDSSCSDESGTNRTSVLGGRTIRNS
jgi:hypothetical protein